MVAEPDLPEVAKAAIAAGLFSTDPEAVRTNADVPVRYQRTPSSLLDVPYGNGPIAMEIYRQDVPETSVFAVRRNFTKANRLLLPPEQVLRYFHQRFVADDVFASEYLVRLVDQYRAQIPVDLDERVRDLLRPALFHHGRASDVASDQETAGAARDARGEQRLPERADGRHQRFRDPALSFRIEGVDRKSRTRVLYTQEEQIEGLRLVHNAPALVLAILAYQSVLLRYLGVLRETFQAAVGDSLLTPDALDDFDKYITQWETQNFTTELVPALAIFMRLRQPSLDLAECGSAVDTALFRDAVTFTVAQGAFRNWIPVPDQGSERGDRVNHFLCPAVGTVREQLLDGSLLASIYEVIGAKERAKDERVSSLLETVRAEVSKRLAQLDATFTEEDIARLRARATMDFSYRGRRYTLRLDAPNFHDLIRGDLKRDDISIVPPVGSWFFDVARQAVAMTLERRKAVSFQFNERAYRLTPGSLADFLRAQGASHGVSM